MHRASELLIAAAVVVVVVVPDVTQDRNMRQDERLKCISFTFIFPQFSINRLSYTLPSVPSLSSGHL